MTDWARRRGYQVGTVSAVWHRWAWRPDARPHGGLARQVMADLWRDYPRLRAVLRREMARAARGPIDEAA